MKKRIGFLCYTLLLGVMVLFNTEGELPLHWFRPFLRIQLSKVTLKDHNLILFNVKLVRKKLEFQCPKLSLRLKRNGTVCHIQQATLKYGPHIFSPINGIIQKHRGVYKTFLELANKDISKIQIVCDSFSPKTFEKLADSVHDLSKISSKNLSLQGLKIHVTEKHIFNYADDIIWDRMQAKNVYGKLSIDGAWLKYSQKANFFQYQHLSLAPVHCNGSLNFRKGLLRHTFVQGQTVHELLGPTTFSLGAYDVYWRKQIPMYIQLRGGALDAEGKFSDLKHLELERGFAKCTSVDLLRRWKYLRSHDLSLQQPLYLRFSGNPQHLKGVWDTKHMSLEDFPLHHIHSSFKIENKEKFSWNAHLYADKTHPRISGFYDIHQDLGELYCSGRISPEFTYIFKAYLPDWWEQFFKQFRFNKAHPYANFSLLFKTNEPYSLCFGFASAKNVHFKQSHLQQLHMNFGNCPGYCWLRINYLKMNQKHGACEIHWPYAIPDSQKERWIFNGNGNFKAREWRHLLEDFIGGSEKFAILERFNLNAEIQANFKGIISSESTKKDYLAVGLKVPKGLVWDFPVRNFSVDYTWNPDSTEIKNLQTKLCGGSPIIADISLKKEHFCFKLKGQHIATKSLLRHPLFYTWTKAIPKDNLETYDGTLELDIKGEGNCSNSISVSGNGHLEFLNPNLSRVHILGPLTRLFSKKFRLTTVSFDKLISDFSFTEQRILTQKSMLLGPSTRADLRGQIDLSQQKIQGEIHFSFLDYKQLNFPVMKHFVQIFQPISKGFSAKISGTFSDPQWNLSFNPLRFALPK